MTLKKTIQHRTLAIFLFALFAAQVTGAQAPATDDAVLLKDLTSVIALLGLPCGPVVKAKKLKDDDHIATCKDGNVYRVYLNAEGRIVAEKK